MADIGYSLRIKYGLRHDPSPALAQEWAHQTRAFIREGNSQEEAGRRAARAVFSDYNTYVYASEADTIELLLQQVRKK